MQLVSLISGALPSIKEIISLPEYIRNKVQPRIVVLNDMRREWDHAVQRRDTVLHLAIRMCSVETIHLLLFLEPRLIVQKNKAGETPLYIAETLQSKNPEVLAALKKYPILFNDPENDFELENWLVKDSVETEIKDSVKQGMLFSYNSHQMSRCLDSAQLQQEETVERRCMASPRWY